jgi:membrane protein YqaA with SNARE-associated domain
VLLDRAITFAAQAAKKHPSRYMVLLRHWGAFGLFFFAILDSSPLPTFGGLDILIAILAARAREPWYLYAAVATVGAMIGAYLTFHLAKKAGSSYLQKKFGERRVAKLLCYFEKYGTGALVVTSAVPFPFPTSAFFAAAGVLDYPARKFGTVVSFSRAVRYSAVALIAAHYGRHFVRALRHPNQYYGWLILLAVVAIAITAAAVALSRWLDSVPTPAESPLAVSMNRVASNIQK